MASHELLTLLASIRMFSQLAGSASTDHEWQEALRSIRVGVDRTWHLLGQPFDLAHVERLSWVAQRHFELVISERQISIAAQIETGPMFGPPSRSLHAAAQPAEQRHQVQT